MNEANISDVMQAYAQDAVDFAHERFQIQLDFSEDSIQSVEKILAKLHDSLPKGIIAKILHKGPSNEQIFQMSKMWGAYIGEVIRLRWNGTWKTETDAHPGVVMTLRVFDSDIFPPAKVFKRLNNGPEDNIWIYYQVLKQGFESS